ncbi:MAG: tRNA (adenosine(37)-N6)-dimethylallyltransferase MiaA [Bacteroidetes bacterium]|nr:tRNA (adenosine(37)-N6)-dimethylallyltransferase MiaA [Bacteroidota bacterium]
MGAKGERPGGMNHWEKSERVVTAIVGPTCTGKTDTGIELAKLVDGEIISADSRQIHKLIDIGTAKPTPDQRRKVPHHLVDIVPLDETISAGAYAALAKYAINEVFDREKTPILVGGSGLYLRSVIDGLFEAPEIDPKIRSGLRQRLATEGREKLLEELKRVDPSAAHGLVPGNYKRVLRGLEVFYSSGRRISELQKELPDPPSFSTVQFGITRDRKELYRRIEERADDMIGAGLVEEVRAILGRGIDPSLNSLQTTGYMETIKYLRGEIKFEVMVELIKMNTRRYAKRQMTWFRKDNRIIWMEGTGKSPGEMAEEIWQRLKKVKRG